MPVVSVIVPAFNAERWIDECLISVLAQTYQDFEVIVVDDGSQDATAERALAHGDTRVRVIRQNNLGASAARNRGIRESRGSFIQFLDADDLLGPEKLEKQLRFLIDGPANAIASCGWAKFEKSIGDAVLSPEPVWTEPDPLEWLVRSFSGEGMMQPGAWLVPRDLIDRAGPWDETITLHDDGEYFARVLLLASVNLFVGGPLVYYRNVPGSLSKTVSIKAVKSSLAVCRSKEKVLCARSSDIRIRRALACQYAQFLYQFGDVDRALSEQAMKALFRLKVEPLAINGGRLFRLMTQLVGFRFALQARGVLLRKH